MSAAPEPSRSSVTLMSVSRVARRTVTRRPSRATTSREPRGVVIAGGRSLGRPVRLGLDLVGLDRAGGGDQAVVAGPVADRQAQAVGERMAGPERARHQA